MFQGFGSKSRDRGLAVGHPWGDERGRQSPLHDLRVRKIKTSNQSGGRPQPEVPDPEGGQARGRPSYRSDLFLPASASSVHVSRDAEGATVVRHPALQDHRHGQLHAGQEQRGRKCCLTRRTLAERKSTESYITKLSYKV